MSEKREVGYQNECALRIMEALSAVDEELLERCGMAQEAAEDVGKTAGILKYRKQRKPMWKMGRAWAACLGLLVVGVISWNGLRLVFGPKGAANYNGSALSGGAANENLASDAAAPEEWFEGETQTEAKTTESAPTADSADINREEEGSRGNGGMSDLEAQTSTSEKFNEESSLGSDTGTISDAGDVEYVTEEEARSFMPLGAYIPENLPEGYHMETAYINSESQSVTMTWSRGMDYIMISVSSVKAGTVETVDVNKPETYDERLYEIPHADTVPKEYRESVDNPVFDFSDMNSDTGLELMNSRMISYSDAGDTDTPRGRFSVLINDGILLYFNGRGTPQEIWNMLYSMKR